VDNNRSGRLKPRLTAQDRVRREKNARTAIFGGAVTSVIAGVAIIAGTRDGGADAVEPTVPAQVASPTPGNLVGDATGIMDDATAEATRTPIPHRWSEDDERESDDEWDEEDESERAEPATIPSSTPTPTARASSSGNSIVIQQPTPHVRTRSTPSR
jgi:hypothetical protein